MKLFSLLHNHLSRSQCHVAKHKALPIIALLVLFTGAFNLSGCSFFEPHKIPIQQGNAVTQEMVNKLKPDMTKRQVLYILGTPLIIDPFNPDQWHYNYKIQRGVKVITRYRFSVHFENDKLVSFTGDFKPTNTDTTDDDPTLSDNTQSEQQDATN